MLILRKRKAMLDNLNLTIIYGFFILLFIKSTVSKVSQLKSVGNLTHCYPKSDNYTLCYGARFLQKHNRFADLLQNSNNVGYIGRYQANIWIILLQTQCHEDLELLLCSIYSPICTKGHQLYRIPVCQEMCYGVMRQCLPRMRIYGFEWPTMADCSILPSRKNSVCIDLTKKPEPINSMLNKIKRQREDRSLNDQCKVCHKKAGLETIAQQFCTHPLIIKAKIANVFQGAEETLIVKLHPRSRRVYAKYQLTSSVVNLVAEIRCKCQLLRQVPIQKRIYRGKYLLMGDLREDGHFIVRFLVKWKRRNKKFRYLVKQLRRKRQQYCKNGFTNLLSYIRTNNIGRKLNNKKRRNRKRRKRRKMKEKRFNKDKNNKIKRRSRLYDNLYLKYGYIRG